MHPDDRRLQFLHVVAVDQDLAWRVGGQVELRERDVREGDPVGQEARRLLPARGLPEQPAEGVALVGRLLERVLDPLAPAAGLEPEPLASGLLDPAALDLQAEDSVLGMGHDEVRLPHPRAVLALGDQKGRGVEDVPRVVQLITSHREQVALRLRDVRSGRERTGIHARHATFPIRVRSIWQVGVRCRGQPATPVG